MVIPAPTPCAKSKKKYSVVVNEDKTGPSLSQCSQYLPVFLENREHSDSMFYHLCAYQHAGNFLKNCRSQTGTQEKLTNSHNDRKTTFLHKC